MSSDLHCPVLIVGGGLVGASLALALAREGVGATLVESRPSALAVADPERERFLALARSSVNALQALGVWPEVEPHSCAIRAVHVSRRGDFGRLLLRATEQGVDRFGAVVPASRLGLALEHALQRAEGLTRIAPATLSRFDVAAAAVEARIDQAGVERRVRTALLVGADGVDSSVRAWADLPVEREDYGQDALVQAVGLSRDHAGIACERFTDDGAIALLPLPGRRAGLVWTLAHERAGMIAALSDRARLDALQDAFGQRLGRFHSPARLIRYPLSRSYAVELSRPRVVVIGNAAQALHPVAAQGFNLGLRDALVLAEEVALAFYARRQASGSPSATSRSHDGRSELSRDVGSAETMASVLDRYGQRRRADRSRIAALSHALARWPKVRAPGLSALRSLALAGMNVMPGAGEAIALAAMGYGDDAPLLALDPAA